MRDRELDPPRRLYDAVLLLRRRGRRVYRHGPDRHVLDGVIVSSAWLRGMAAAESDPPQRESAP